MLTQTLSVMGMKCAGCAAKVTKGMAQVAGVAKVEVSLDSGTVTLRYDERVTGLGQLRSAINSLGYGIDDLRTYAGDGC
jgi:copper chaperone CopZ